MEDEKIQIMNNCLEWSGLFRMVSRLGCWEPEHLLRAHVCKSGAVSASLNFFNPMIFRLVIELYEK